MKSGNVLSAFSRYADIIIPLAIISIVVIIIIPINPFLLDVLLTVSIAFAVAVLLLTMFTTETLQLASFPSLLLVATLFRLSLNISSTRLILSEAQAGNLIHAFGEFVIGGNYVVGMVIFAIITVIQFVVITNGSGRIAEVAARFTLDAMPGKQMSIDADFNAGIINEETAKRRRDELHRSANFFGAMDGASKFVRGDAIAGIVIVLINILGGLIIGVVQMDMSFDTAVATYVRLTVGDGLVSLVPALLISSAAGMLVTRSTGEKSFGTDMYKQLFNFPKVTGLTAGILMLFGLVPAIPFIPFFILSVSGGFMTYLLLQDDKDKEGEAREREAAKKEESSEIPEDVSSFLKTEIMEIEIGYNLIPLTDKSQGGDLLERVTATRQQCAQELGLLISPIRIRDNLQLDPNFYVIKIKGVEIARYSLIPNYYLALNPAQVKEDIEGIETKEPTFELPAKWISETEKEKAETLGYTVVDASTVLITHLMEIVKSHAHELLTRQEVKSMVDTIKESHSAVVEELVPDLMNLGEIQKVLQGLLKERVPIKDLLTILEVLADHAPNTKDTDTLIECTRQSLGRTICKQYLNDHNKLFVFTIAPQVEEKIAESAQQSLNGNYPALDPQTTQAIFQSLGSVVEKMKQTGTQPVVLCSSKTRLLFKRLTERMMPDLAALSVNEIPPNVMVESIGMVNVNEN